MSGTLALTEFELQRERNIVENKNLLLELQLTGDNVIATSAASKKRKLSASPKKRKPKVPALPARKSTRLQNQAVAPVYLPSDDESETGVVRRTATRMKARADSLRQTETEEETQQEKLVKVFSKFHGPIQGVAVGATFDTRVQACYAGIHAATVAGICGNQEAGAYSVALSGGYDEDVDEGENFIYTGSGGRDLKTKNLRTAPQTFDQTLNTRNNVLMESYKNGKPIRVLRGFKNPHGPESGYRYDGLYKVTAWSHEIGSTGKWKVYRFWFKRLPGQAPLPFTI